MKHCEKQADTPHGLGKYLSENPTGTWDEFKDEEPESHKEVVDALSNDQRGICAYCELELSSNNIQVGHFHPKSDRTGNLNWALEWTNLWLCCKGGTQTWLESDPRIYKKPLPQNRSCDENKMDLVLDGKVLSPDSVPSYPRLFRYRQWSDALEIHLDEVQTGDAAVDTNLVEETIKAFNLNCPRLAAARLQVLRNLERDIKQAISGGAKNLADTHLPAKWLSPQSNGYYRSFFTLIRWRLGEAAEQYLLKTSFRG